MPFTFSHPAAVLPLTYLPKRWVSLTGLVFGSMSPDFEYFIRMRIYSSYSHTWAGLFWFDLPLSIVLGFLFHLVIRDRLVDNTPEFLRQRLTVFKQFRWAYYFQECWLVIIISSIIGIATHLIWDGFTHQHGLFVQKFRGLQRMIEVAGHAVPLFKILQHGSSALGGLLVIYSLMQFPVHEIPKSRLGKSFYWLYVTLATVFVVSIKILTGSDYHLIGNLITVSITGAIVGLIVTPGILTMTENSVKRI